MPVMIILLLFLALLIWGNLSRKSPSHPLNNLGTVNPFTPVCTTKNTAGDNFGSGCAFTAGVSEPTTPLTCSNAIFSCDIATIAHFPVEPPPLSLVKTPATIAPKPVLSNPAPAQTLLSPPKQIFPVPVGYHNNVLPARTQITNTVLLRQAPALTPIRKANGDVCKIATKLGIYIDPYGRYHIGSVGVGGRYIPKITGTLCCGGQQHTGINYTA